MTSLLQSIPSPTKIREELERMVLKDLLGPVGGPEEEIDEPSVRDRYLVGMLAPKRQELSPEEFDELPQGGSGSAEDGTAETTSPATKTMFPSSFGMTFCVGLDTQALQITARWGHYHRDRSEHLATPGGEKKVVWKRSQREAVSEPIPLTAGRLNWTPDAEFPQVEVQGLVRKRDHFWSVTLFLVNGQAEPEEAPGHGVAVPARTGRRVPRPRAGLPEPRPPARPRQGRPGGVRRGAGDGDALPPPRRVRRRPRRQPPRRLPRGRLRPGPPALDRGGPHPRGAPHHAPDRRRLAQAGRAGRGHEGAGRDADPRTGGEAAAPARPPMRRGSRTGRPTSTKPDMAPYQTPGQTALERCREALRRIEAGLELLAEDEQAAEAFRFTNRAMWLQRIHTIISLRRRRDEPVDERAIDVPANRSWYPFQLAFILLNLPGITRLDHPDRGEAAEAVADLLWFPTGGGKTEAYLGLTAYTLALRRLQGTVAGPLRRDGVAVLMRYTLRLLTLQQFQRATALICACEVIRREAERGDTLGQGRRSASACGSGQTTTPNTTDQSRRGDQAGARRQVQGAGGSGSPAPADQLPVVRRRRSTPASTSRSRRYAKGRCRTSAYCGDKFGQCPFTAQELADEGMPVVVVDEEIYRRLPTLLIATVDKFAQMPWNGEVQMLFGQVDGYCERHGFRSPEIEDADTPPQEGQACPRRKTDGPPAAAAPRPDHPGRAAPDLRAARDAGRPVRDGRGPALLLGGGRQDGPAQGGRLDGDDPQGRGSGPRPVPAGRRASSRRTASTCGTTSSPSSGPPSEDTPGRRYIGICAPGRRLKAP